MKIVSCARALVSGRERRDFSFAVDGGRIAAVAPAAELRARFPGADAIVFGEETFVAPGLVNGHSHGYQILMRGWADDLPFERWRSEALYKVVPQLSPPQIYWTFRAAFDEMLAAGITTVAEFFYLNGAGNAHAREAIGAAADAGIRLIFARTWMDAGYAPAAFTETIDQAAARTGALMSEFATVPICVAPHSLHAASPEMIRAAAEFARDRHCMLHVHVAEAPYEAAQTLELFGKTPIVQLAELGALNERTVAVHAIYVTEEEKELIARANARVIHNPTTNQYLGDGICDVTGLQALGVKMGLGTDADVKPSILEEMRAAALLQKIARLDGSALRAGISFDLGTAQGAAALDIDAGDLHEGAFADFVVFDGDFVDPWTPLVNALVYRADSGCVRETYVGGRRVRSRGDARPRGIADQMEALQPLLRL